MLGLVSRTASTQQLILAWDSYLSPLVAFDSMIAHSQRSHLCILADFRIELWFEKALLHHCHESPQWMLNLNLIILSKELPRSNS